GLSNRDGDFRDVHALLDGNAENVYRAGAAPHLHRRQRCGADIESERIEGLLDAAREEHLTGTGTLTQACGDVHRIADERIAHVRARADVAGHHVAFVDADAESRIDPVALLPRMGEPLEVLEHLLCGVHRATGAVGLLEWHAEAEHQAVSRHVKDRAVVAEGDLGEQGEVLVEQRHHLARCEPLRDGRESAQVREQDHCVGAQILGGEQRVAQLRVFEDLVGEPRREVAAEGAAQHLLPAPYLRLELRGRELAAHRSRTHQLLDAGLQRLIDGQDLIPGYSSAKIEGYHSSRPAQQASEPLESRPPRAMAWRDNRRAVCSVRSAHWRVWNDDITVAAPVLEPPPYAKPIPSFAILSPGPPRDSRGPVPFLRDGRRRRVG